MYVVVRSIKFLVPYRELYQKLRESGAIVEREEVPPPTVPMDYDWARELGLIRKPASFMTSIVDERGQDVLYAGIPISEVISKDLGIGGVLSLLWFQRLCVRTNIMLHSDILYHSFDRSLYCSLVFASLHNRLA